MIEQIAPGVRLISTWPGYRLNAYILEHVLVDTGTRWDAKRLLRALRDTQLGAVALTHAHPDHQGSAHAICDALNLPLACPAADAEAMAGTAPLPPVHRLGRAVVPLLAGPRHPVARVLSDGDEIAGFRVVHAPGHTPGHSMFWRESDGVLIAGDVLANMSVLFGTEGLREPPRIFSSDWKMNRKSIVHMLELQPKVICFGHGPPLKDVGVLQSFPDRLGITEA